MCRNLLSLLLLFAAAAAASADTPPDLCAALRDPAKAFRHKSFEQLEEEWRHLKAPARRGEVTRRRLAREVRKLGVANRRADARRVRRHLAPVLKLYGRPATRVFVYASYERNIYLFHGEALLVSTGLLDLIDGDGLTAVAAHELAHLYAPEIREDARRRGDFSLMRRVELFCDAFAVAALRRLKVDAGAYGRALRRMDVLGPGEFVIAPTHPPLAERLALIEELGGSAP